ncbi:MAG: hypothetical protein ABIW76_13420 [Fibrobacteria bacterium]
MWLDSMVGTQGKLRENGDRDMLQMNRLKAGLLILAATGLASAHLSDKSLSIKGGETFTPNQSVTISWGVGVLHAGCDIDLSLNGGTSWTTLKEDFKEVKNSNSFKWTVPATATQTARIRICQHQSTSTPGCKDSEVTSNPSGTTKDGNYILVSPAFTIAAATGLGHASASQGAFAIDFISATRNVNVSFALAESGPVLLQAFDARGRLVATLMEGDYAAGSHKLSLFSNRLDATETSLLFQFKAGNQVQSRIWSSAR